MTVSSSFCQQESLIQRALWMKEALMTCGPMIERIRHEMLASDVSSKRDAADLVTRAGHACDSWLREEISKRFEKDAFLTEENGLTLKVASNSLHTKEYDWDTVINLPSVWIIDPLDGTTNFVHRLEHYAISIAWMSKGQVKIGGIYLPPSGELFFAIKDGGAYCNEKRIRVNALSELKQGLFSTGLCISGKGLREKHLEEIGEVADVSRGVRHLGSAACNLVKLAQGVFDGFWIRLVKPWDAAAGILIAEEAGAMVTPLSPGLCPLASGSFLAASPAILPLLQKMIFDRP